MLARASEYLPESMVFPLGGSSPGKPQRISPSLVWLNFLLHPRLAEEIRSTSASLLSIASPKGPILQRGKLRPTGPKGCLGEWESSYSSLASSACSRPQLPP